MHPARLIKQRVNGLGGPDEDQQMGFHTGCLSAPHCAMFPPKPPQLAAQHGLPPALFPPPPKTPLACK